MPGLAGGIAAFDRIATLIASANAAGLREIAAGFDTLGASATAGGDRFAESAITVSATPGAPYQTYHARLMPTAEWMRAVPTATAPISAGLTDAAVAVEAAQEALAKEHAALSAMTFTGSTQAEADAAMSQAYMAAAQRLQPYVDAVEESYAAIEPTESARPPEPRGGTNSAATNAAAASSSATAAGTTAGATGAGGGSSASAAGSAGGAAATTTAGGAEAGAGPEGIAAAAGGGAVPAEFTSNNAGGIPGAVSDAGGAYDGWVRMPNGDLVNPTTGAAVNSSGQMLDPLTGEPMGSYDTRLAGAVGSTSPVGGLFGGGTGGVPGGVAATAGIGGGPGGMSTAGGGVGIAPIAGAYGGVVPPSLRGNSPISGQLVRQANDNMALRGATARNFASLTSGNGLPGGPPGSSGFIPPMGGMGAGAGAGAGAGGRSATTSRGLVREPRSTWGGVRSANAGRPTPIPGTVVAAGEGDRPRNRRRGERDEEPGHIWGAVVAGAPRRQRDAAGRRMDETEDAEAWTGGPARDGGALA